MTYDRIKKWKVRDFRRVSDFPLCFKKNHVSKMVVLARAKEKNML